MSKRKVEKNVKLPGELAAQILELAEPIGQGCTGWVRLTCQDVVKMCDPHQAPFVPRVVTWIRDVRNQKSIGKEILPISGQESVG